MGAGAWVAKGNVERLGLSDRVTVELGDLFEPISRQVDARPFDLIVSNPPYVSAAEIEGLEPEVAVHEPRLWPEYHPGYYGAFVRDPEGNNVEAVFHGAQPEAQVPMNSA